jgi:hypothetical protein
MNAIYIPATQTIIRSYSDRYVYNGEVYGGTDYDDAAKLAEIGAVPVVDADGTVPANPVRVGETVVVADGVATITKTWRTKTAEELAADAVTVAQAALAATEESSAATRKIEDLYDLLIDGNVLATVDLPAPVAAWLAERKAQRLASS